MSEPKSNLPIIVGVVALLVIAGGGAFYFSKNMTKDETVTAQNTATPADTSVAANSEAPSAGSTNKTGEPPATAEETDETSKAVKAAGTFSGVTPKEGNPVVAKVDDQDITRVDVFRYIRMMPPQVQQLPPTAVYPMALEQVINTRIAQNKAESAGLENDPEVKQQMDMARQQIIRSIYIQRTVEKEISDADLKKKYDEEIGKLAPVKEIKAAHILVDSEQKAKDIIAQLNKGADFAKLAAANSADPGNKDKGGELGWFKQGEMVPEFSDAAFKLSKGDISKEPVKTQFGWHIIKVEDKRDVPKPTFEDSKQALKNEVGRDKLEAMLEDWRKTASIEKFDINGDPIKAQPDVAPAAGEPSASPAEGAESTPADAAPAPAAK